MSQNSQRSPDCRAGQVVRLVRHLRLYHFKRSQKRNCPTSAECVRMWNLAICESSLLKPANADFFISLAFCFCGNGSTRTASHSEAGCSASQGYFLLPNVAFPKVGGRCLIELPFTV